MKLALILQAVQRKSMISVKQLVGILVLVITGLTRHFYIATVKHKRLYLVPMLAMRKASIISVK